MARTLIFFFLFWTILLASLPLLLFLYLLSLLKYHDTKKKASSFLIRHWARFTLFTAGIKIKKTGSLNLPVSESKYVIISNHQGNFDIPVFMAVLPFAPSFIAKQELAGIPLIRGWMKALECLAIDRTDPEGSRKKISERIMHSEKNPVIIFPEGTRSRGPKMLNFKTGSLKILFQNNIDILPVTINGTYLSYEKKNKIKPAVVKVCFHPVLKTSSYEQGGFMIFLEDLRRIISGPIEQ